MSGTSIWSDGSCDLWLVADARTSRWSRRIDWYLNFQVMKAERHRSAEPAPELRAIQSEWPLDPGVSIPSRMEAATPLMVAGRGLLPCSKAVFIDYHDDVKTWAQSCITTWRQLGEPRARIFLPDQVDASLFATAWTAAGGTSPGPDLISASRCQDP